MDSHSPKKPTPPSPADAADLTIGHRWHSRIGQWIRRLAIADAVLSICLAGWLFSILASAPEPLRFVVQSTHDDIVRDGEAMLEHLAGQDELGLFREPDESWVEFLIDSARDDRNESEVPVQLSERILDAYEGEFEIHRISADYLWKASLWVAVLSALVAAVPRVWTASLLLVFSLAGSSFHSELVFGKDLSDLFIYTLPHVCIAIAIFVLAVVGWFTGKFVHHATLGAAYSMIAFGMFSIVLGVAWASVEIVEGDSPTYKETQGIAAPIAMGLLCLVNGVKSWLAIKREERTET